MSLDHLLQTKTSMLMQIPNLYFPKDCVQHANLCDKMFMSADWKAHMTVACIYTQIQTPPSINLSNKRHILSPSPWMNSPIFLVNRLSLRSPGLEALSSSYYLLHSNSFLFSCSFSRLFPYFCS